MCWTSMMHIAPTSTVSHVTHQTKWSSRTAAKPGNHLVRKITCQRVKLQYNLHGVEKPARTDTALWAFCCHCMTENRSGHTALLHTSAGCCISPSVIRRPSFVVSYQYQFQSICISYKKYNQSNHCMPQALSGLHCSNCTEDGQARTTVQCYQAMSMDSLQPISTDC